MSEENLDTPVEEVEEIKEVENLDTEIKEIPKEEIKPDPVQSAINKKHFQMKEAERSAQAANDRSAELEKRIREIEQSKVPDSVPEMPDPYDDDYDDKIKARDSAIQSIAQNQANQQFQQNQQQQVQLQQQQTRMDDLNKSVQSYTDKAKEQGITPQELEQAGAVVASHGISDDLTMAIIADEDGALITKHLASNPLELQSLSLMNPIQAAMYIERTVRPKISELKPKQSNTPNPSEDVKGGGGDTEAGRYRNIKGAKFE